MEIVNVLTLEGSARYLTNVLRNNDKYKIDTKIREIKVKTFLLSLNCSSFHVATVKEALISGRKSNLEET